MEKRTHKIPAWLIAALIVYCTGFAVAAAYDLAINEALYQPGNPLAIIYECFGWYPAYAPAILLLMLAATQPRSEKYKLWMNVVMSAVCMVGFGLVLYNSYKDLHKRGVAGGLADWGTWLSLLPSILLLFAALALVGRTRAGALRTKLWMLARWGTALLALDQVVINILKTLWSRTRFDDMVAAGAGFGDFTPWFRPFGNGGSSFPSGHTSNAACILLLLVLCDLFPAWDKRRKLVCAVCWAYIALMGLCRVLIGRHYISDALGGSAVIATIFYLLHHSRWYKKDLANTLAKTEAK